MRIRAAEPKDLRAIVEIERLCFPEETAFPPGMFAYLIKYAVSLVACKSDAKNGGNEVAGFIIGYASGRMGVIYTLDVHPDCRARGLGFALIAALERELCARGVETIRLEAAVDNPVAVGLYRRAGYRGKEMIRNYYGSGKDAVRMWKAIACV